MPNLKVSRYDGRPILNIASYARRGPGQRDRLSLSELALVTRTTQRVPEVVVKVLTKGSTELSSVAKHFGYIGRYGALALETEDGEQLQGRGVGRELLENWDLDLDEYRGRMDLRGSRGHEPSKLIHKLMFSMPAGTSPQAVLAATRAFLREEFALKHRYAFVLHTDEPHPHVHAVVKAVSEQGVRLSIKKDTLRRWRQDFARHLREQGVEANATDRAARGQSKATKLDSIYRAAARGASWHMRDRLDAVADELASGGLRVEPGKAKLLRTRREVAEGWRALSNLLASGGERELAGDVQRFVQQMQPARTEREWLAAELLSRARDGRSREHSLIRR